MSVVENIVNSIPKESLVSKILSFLKSIPLIGNALYNSIGIYIAIIGAYISWALSGIPGMISLVLLFYLLFKILSVLFSFVVFLGLFALPLLFVYLGIGLLQSLALTFLILGVYVIYKLGFDLTFLIPLAVFVALLFFGGFLQI